MFESQCDFQAVALLIWQERVCCHERERTPLPSGTEMKLAPSECSPVLCADDKYEQMLTLQSNARLGIPSHIWPATKEHQPHQGPSEFLTGSNSYQTLISVDKCTGQ